jgi:ABC-type amino acid transport substrate-binding protein
VVPDRRSLAGAALTVAPPCPARPSASSPSPVIDRIVQSGELRVGTSGTQPPLSATAKDGSLMGFDIEIANAMAKAMGVKLTLVPMDFADLLSAVQKGDVDMVLSGSHDAAAQYEGGIRRPLPGVGHVAAHQVEDHGQAA